MADPQTRQVARALGRHEATAGTLVSAVQLEAAGVTVTRYWRTASVSGAGTTEPVTLMFADDGEFRAFVRALQREGRRRGWLTHRKHRGGGEQ